MSAAISAAVIAAGAAASAANQQKIAQRRAAEQQQLQSANMPGVSSPGPVQSSGGGSMVYDPSTGATQFYQPSQGSTYDQMRYALMMDQLMGGSGATNNLQSQIRAQELKIKQMQGKGGGEPRASGPALNPADYVGEVWTMKDPKTGEVRPAKGFSDLEQDPAARARLANLYNEQVAAGYTKEPFEKWAVMAYNQGGIGSKIEDYNKATKTAGASADITSGNIETEQNRLKELQDLLTNAQGMQGDIANNPLFNTQMSGRRGSGEGPTNQNGEPIQGVTDPSLLNYDMAFNDPRKSQLQGIADDYLGRAQDGSKALDDPIDWLGRTGMSQGEWQSMIQGGGGNFDRIDAPDADLTGLGALQNWMQTQATNQYQANANQNRERMARAGIGFGSQSAIGELAAQQSLNDAQAQNAANIFGLRQGVLNNAFSNKAQAAGINNAAAAQQAGLKYQGAGLMAGLGEQFRTGDYNRNAGLFGQGMQAFNAQTGLQQADIDNSMRNESMGMAQDLQAQQQKMSLLDWVRNGQQQSFNQGIQQQQADMGQFGLGNQIGQNFTGNQTAMQLAQANMNNANTQSQLQGDIGRNQMYASAFGTLMNGAMGAARPSTSSDSAPAYTTTTQATVPTNAGYMINQAPVDYGALLNTIQPR